MAWEIGIPTMGPPRGEPHCILGELGKRRITHVILGNVAGGESPYLAATLAHSPDRFSLEYENRLFTVYAFRPGPDALTFEQLPECQRR